jgi:hypothetical protein
VARLLDDQAALSQWGGRVLAELVEAIPQVAAPTRRLRCAGPAPYEPSTSRARRPWRCSHDRC